MQWQCCTLPRYQPFSLPENEIESKSQLMELKCTALRSSLRWVDMRLLRNVARVDGNIFPWKKIWDCNKLADPDADVSGKLFTTLHFDSSARQDLSSVSPSEITQQELVLALLNLVVKLQIQLQLQSQKSEFHCSKTDWGLQIKPTPFQVLFKCLSSAWGYIILVSVKLMHSKL